MKITLDKTQISILMEKARLYGTQWASCGTVSFKLADNKFTMFMIDKTTNAYIRTSVNLTYEANPVYFSLNKIMWNTLLGKYNCEETITLDYNGSNTVDFIAGNKTVSLACSTFDDPDGIDSFFTDTANSIQQNGTILNLTNELLDNIDIAYALYRENNKYKDYNEPIIKITNNKFFYMDHLLVGMVAELDSPTNVPEEGIRMVMDMIPVFKAALPFNSTYHIYSGINGDLSIYWADDTTEFIVSSPLMTEDTCEEEIEASKPSDMSNGFDVSLYEFNTAMKLFNGFYETEYKEFIIDAKAGDSLTLHLNSYNVHIDEIVQDTIPTITGKVGVRGPNVDTVIESMLKKSISSARMYFDSEDARSLGCNIEDKYFFIFGTIGDYSEEE